MDSAPAPVTRARRRLNLPFLLALAVVVALSEAGPS